MARIMSLVVGRGGEKNKASSCFRIPASLHPRRRASSGYWKQNYTATQEGCAEMKEGSWGIWIEWQ
jgi:hypothetical protein